MALDEDRRKALLREVERVLDRPYELAHPRHAFLPLPQHQKLLVDRPLLVVGERGAGKSALFRFLKELGRDVASIFPGLRQRLDWVSGFEDDLDQPATGPLWSWARGRGASELQHFWLGHLIGWLVRTNEIQGLLPLPWLDEWRRQPSDPGAWVPGVTASLPRIHQALDVVERRLRAEDRVLVIGYDDLDRVEMGDRLGVARELVVGLVGVWHGLGVRHRNLQARVLLRPELADHVRIGSADASKLRDRTLRLQWTAEDVFRALLHRFAGSESLRGWLAPTIPFSEDSVLGWVPPAALPEHPQLPLPFGAGTPRRVPTQDAFGTHLVGPAMGAGPRKGRVHTWLLNHTRDGVGQYLPRVFLNLVRNAARAALDSADPARDDHLLRPEDLAAALQPTGAQRLEELAEVYPEPIAELRRLTGKQVPMEVLETEAAISSDHLQRLISVGVATKRETDGRIDVPELFRSALSLRRKGGPRRR